MRRTTPARLLAGACLAAVLALGACGGDDTDTDARPTPRPTTGAATPPTTAAPSRTPATPTGPASPAAERVRLLGIDASHHQGPIDWRAVADDGYSFAYLKATEGTSFTDPAFATHRREALEVGLSVGGYHYFQLCTPGVAQAEHFVSVLGDVGGGNHLPPALDLELAGSCATPPPRATLLAEVEAFLGHVEERIGREPVVYLYPELEARFGFARELADHRQWVRSLGSRPQREFWVWQQSDSGAVRGIQGPVDINVMWQRRVAGR